MNGNHPKQPLTSTALSSLTPAMLIGIIEQQQAVIEQQQAAVTQLQREISELKERLNSDSRTSSKPPSSDLLKKSEKPSKQRARGGSGRKAGGQPGHEGKTRQGFSRIDRAEVLRPSQCPSCGGSAFALEPVKVRQHQVARLVDRPIEIVAYHHQHCRCACGEVVSAPWPADVLPRQDLSLGLQSLLAWLGNYGHLSYGKQQELLKALGDIDIGLGTLQATNSRVADAVIRPVDQLWHWLRGQDHVQVDETPWCVQGVKEWLWVAGGDSFCLFHAADSRSRDELRTMLGESFDGVLSSDDFSVYNGYGARAQQKCLAHLRRHFKRLQATASGVNQRMAKALLKRLDEAFAQHRQWRAGEGKTAYANWAATFKTRLAAALKRWKPKVDGTALTLLKSLQKKDAQWWYFLEHPHIPPDNNLAERLIRLAVTKRKVCGGSRSLLRFEQTADLLSVIQTCRRQGRSALSFFQQALMAYHDKVPTPSLIPVPST
jgi:transposase